jgi:hypothetical protein
MTVSLRAVCRVKERGAHLKQVRVGIQGSKKWMEFLKKNVSLFPEAEK